MTANVWYTPPTLSRHATGSDGKPDPRTPVGVVAPNYGLEHVSYLMQLESYRHIKIHRLPLHRLERGGTFWDKTPIVIGARVPLVHTFNMIPMTGPPFVMTFEMEIPYYLGRHRPWQHAIGHRLMASDRCRGLLSFSDTAADLARARFTDLGRPEIAARIETFRGGVLPSLSDAPRSYSDGDTPLRLLFVGADGIRKGLAPLLDAVEALQNRGANVELTVVSSLVETSYVGGAYNPPVGELRARLERPWVHYKRSLPYADVRAAMGRHDLLMLPSLDETLGWVVIEAAMERMGTITTNAFALPELVDDTVTGRILKLPLGDNKRWAGLFRSDRRKIFDDTLAGLQHGMEEALQKVLDDRGTLRRWGEAAHDKLSSLYHTDVAARDLGKIYDRALGR